ncbi:MAG: site-specific DNA-methyltransferase [Patescibacteria group bacterium]|nr:site-specific DNA-methyltransferase [Patescibacteria group bacterium]
MAEIAAGSIDLVLTDLPYGTTYAPWDSAIPLEGLWSAWLRVLRPKGAIVLTASQPFTSQLVMSRPKLFRCEWIWDKVNGANFANANKQPLKTHESVLVFAEGQPTYNPQKTLGKPNHPQGKWAQARNCETQIISERAADDLSGLKFPKSIQTFPKHSSQLRLHSTQKPVELFEYMIRTYTNEGGTVLDCCAGSGTTGEAAMRSGRHAVLIDNDSECVKTMNARLGTILPMGSANG